MKYDGNDASTSMVMVPLVGEAPYETCELIVDVRKGVVLNTDRRWYDYFRPANQRAELDEVNFWRPTAQSTFRAVPEGGPCFFRLKAPVNKIAGFGFFALQTRVPVPLAWDLFGDRNGYTDYYEFRRAIQEYRQRMTFPASEPLNCLVLRDSIFLPDDQWIEWDIHQQWSPNIVALKGYSLDSYPGSLLAELMRAPSRRLIEETFADYEVSLPEKRETELRPMAVREGQGIFRARLLDIYGRRCAITEERSLPTLEAAHIQPYHGRESNHVQNGILLRADFHRLYDTGYVTVTPEYRLEVSKRLSEDFDNGAYYYGLRGREIRVPQDPHLQPSREALRWHNDRIFLP